MCTAAAFTGFNYSAYRVLLLFIVPKVLHISPCFSVRNNNVLFQIPRCFVTECSVAKVFLGRDLRALKIP